MNNSDWMIVGGVMFLPFAFTLFVLMIARSERLNDYSVVDAYVILGLVATVAAGLITSGILTRLR
jgi:hypothetical protein